MNLDRGVVTVAFGSRRYLDMARTLARSVKRNWPGVPIVLVTDSTEFAAPEFDRVILMDESRGRSLMQKLWLDDYSPFTETLFLDSDCVVVRNMDFVWERFAGRAFAVSGSSVTGGDWFGADLASVRRALDLTGPIPKFNGGLMYWTAAGRPVFERARELAGRYAELGFRAFRSGLPEADEPLIAMAMALEGLQAVDDGGSSMATPIGMSGRLRIDSRRGVSRFKKHGEYISPAAPHFCGPYSRGPVYRLQSLYLSPMPADRVARVRRAAVAAVLRAASLVETEASWDVVRRAKNLAAAARPRTARA